MPQKPTITDIRSWFGFVNQLAPFLAAAPIMEPFRDLLKKKQQSRHVYWDENLQRKFECAQEVICKLARDGLAFYDKSRPTIALTDWSREGIGFVVLQQYCVCNTATAPFCCKNGWKIALCGSRHLSQAEAGYAAVEGEALAVVWCLKKARLLLLGCPNLTIVTDHRPLVKLFGDRALSDVANPRLFRLKEKTLQYKFVIKYLPGKRNCAADFLSRFPALCARPDDEDHELEDEMTVAVTMATVDAMQREELVMDEDTVLSAATDDPVYQLLLAKVSTNDWCEHKVQEVACLRPFYNVRSRLSTANDLVLYTYEDGYVRLVIPECLRQQIATNLHAGHQGLDSMLRRARQTVYWPGMEGDLQYQRNQCEACNVHAPSLPEEELALSPPPDYPFQRTVVDMFQLNGYMYMAYADRLTGWLEIAHFPHGTTSQRLMKVLRTYFTRWGAPEEISTDGGTNLVSDEMSSFFKRWAVKVRLSSAQYPQSNGRAEAAVKTAKRIIRSNTGEGGTLDCDRASLAILEYLNTPIRIVNKSPAQLTIGRQLRDGVPKARLHYMVDAHWIQALNNRETQMAENNDKIIASRTSRRHSPLYIGNRVRIQNQATKLWDRTGTIVEALRHRQYNVRLDGSGRISLRNRRHLSIIHAPRPSHESGLPPTSPANLPDAPPSMPDAPPNIPDAPPTRPRRRACRPFWQSDYDLS